MSKDAVIPAEVLMTDDEIVKELRRYTITLLDSQMKWPYMAEALARLLERGTKGQQ